VGPQNTAVIDQHDPRRRSASTSTSGAAGTTPSPAATPASWSSATRCATLLAALHFNVFHAHADRVKMSNIAQMVNVLQAMIQTSRTSWC
jgi:alpha-N-arabinofuranosidase